ncbi:hypothetical protein [Novosphingobium sp. ST904]|uniref:hypothetical protein n=1 Tax=Novosphingobium sp. ST904 TaxID=1684385 RepID=UPI0014051439|nr:hypothetical protein [Novosphingobium sp. ST904]
MQDNFHLNQYSPTKTTPNRVHHDNTSGQIGHTSRRAMDHCPPIHQLAAQETRITVTALLAQNMFMQRKGEPEHAGFP